MEPRERVLAALAGQKPDKVPKALSFYRVDLAAIAPSGYTEESLGLEVRFVEFEPSRAEQRFHRYIQQFPMDTRIGSPSQLRTYSEWSYRPDDEAQRNPLAEAETVADLADYPPPLLLLPLRRSGTRSGCGSRPWARPAWSFAPPTILTSPTSLGRTSWPFWRPPRNTALPPK